MSITPITFERSNLEYTLTGGQDEDLGMIRRSGLSILLLNRGGKPFRKELLRHLSRLGTREIISVESSSSRLNPEDMQKELPNVRLLFFQSKANWGEIINVGIKEALGEYVFVFWNDMDIDGSSISSRVFSKIEERQSFATLPWLLDKEGDLYPSRYIPSKDEAHLLKMLPLPPEEKSNQSLFPFDYTAIYNRSKFLRSGGFDGRIENPYWQLMDLGFRAAMSREQMVHNPALKVHYKEDIPALNITADEDYIQFFLKTLAIRFRGGKAFLPFRHRWGLWLKSPLNLNESRKRFHSIRKWLKENQSCIQQDAMTVMNRWGDL